MESNGKLILFWKKKQHLKNAASGKRSTLNFVVAFFFYIWFFFFFFTEFLFRWHSLSWIGRVFQRASDRRTAVCGVQRCLAALSVAFSHWSLVAPRQMASFRPFTEFFFFNLPSFFFIAFTGVSRTVGFSPGFEGSLRVLWPSVLGFTGFLQGFTELNWVVMGFYTVILSFTGFRRFIPDWTGL